MTYTPLILLLLFVSVLVADDEQAEKKTDNEEAKPKVVSSSGVFESTKVHELNSATEQLKSLTIKRAVEHGTVVKKGQNVLWFQTEDIEEKLQNAEKEFRLAELTMQDDVYAHEHLQKTQQLEKTAFQRTFKAAKQDYDNYVGYDHQRSIESAKFNLKSSRGSLENAEEELKQLEQMYNEDELTEESEEIVLKRAKRSVESAKFYYENAEVKTQRQLKQRIPRTEEEANDKLARAELAYEKAKRSMRAAKEREEIEFTAKQTKFKKAKKDYDALKSERKHLVLRAPRDGVVFHGELIRGKVASKPINLKRDAKVTNTQVLLTIVSPNGLRVRADIQEKDLQHFAVGTKVKVVPTAYPDKVMTGKVKSLAAYPYAANKYDCVVSVKLNKNSSITPGMNCSIKVDVAPDAKTNE